MKGEVTSYTLNSHYLFMTFRHKAFIKIMKYVRDYIFECLRYSQDSNIVLLIQCRFNVVCRVVVLFFLNHAQLS